MTMPNEVTPESLSRWGRPPVDPVERLLRMREVQPDGCWQWTGALTASGTGQFDLAPVSWSQRSVRAYTP